MELREIRVVHYGLGAIGSSIARLTSAQRGLQVVGGIDRDPAKVGCDLGDVIGLDHPLGAPISDDANLVLEQTRPEDPQSLLLVLELALLVLAGDH